MAKRYEDQVTDTWQSAATGSYEAFLSILEILSPESISQSREAVIYGMIRERVEVAMRWHRDREQRAVEIYKIIKAKSPIVGDVVK